MIKKITDIRIIGLFLAVLYGMSFMFFFIYVDGKGIEVNALIYVIFFALLFISSVAVVTLKEWGRKLIVAVNALMFFCLLIRYLPPMGIIPLAYLFMNAIVFMYFNQASIKRFFSNGKKNLWKSILVVDDDEMHIKTVRPLLMAHGFSVLVALTGEDGLQIARTQKPDLILLDVILPGLKGREVCKKLKEMDATKNIPVVFLTAKDSPEDIQAEKEAGGLEHLSKPVQPKVLISTIENILK